MKYLLILLAAVVLFAVSQADAQERCTTISQDVNTPVPKELKGKEICVRDPKTGVSDCSKSMDEYKIVKRKQQFKVKEKIIVSTEPVYIVKEVTRVSEAKQNKNLVMLGVRNDYAKVSQDVSGNTIRVYSEKELVFDLNYFRRMILDSRFGAGLGLDTNGTLRGMLGLEF